MKSVLAVDDSPSMRSMVSLTLEGAGFKVLTAEDGTEAFEMAAKEEIDLVLTDVNMPNMDGITLIRELRGLEKYKFVPILTLTTEKSDAKKAEGRAAGATGWIVKPFEPTHLVAVINKLLD